MSTDAVTQFLAKVGEDGALQEQAKSIAQGNDDTAAAAAKLGSEHGFEFTADEFTQVIEAGRKARAGQLSDAELEGVAGGRTYHKWDGRYEAGAIFFGDDSLQQKIV